MIYDPPAWVMEIVKKIFECEINQAEPFPQGWRLWLGPAAMHLLKTDSPPGMFKVGYRTEEHRITQSGRVGQDQIMGVMLHPDPEAPPRMWRLADMDGRTLAWGEAP